MHGAWQPMVTSHHVPHISQCPKKFLQEAQISCFLIWCIFHWHPCNNAICPYSTWMVSRFNVCYLWFHMCVGQNWLGVCFIMLAVLRTAYTVLVTKNKFVNLPQITCHSLCVLYSSPSPYHLILLCKCTTLFLNPFCVAQNIMNTHFQKGLA